MNKTTPATLQWKKISLLLVALVTALLLLQGAIGLAHAHKAQIVTVNSNNDDPIANDDTATTKPGEAVEIDVLKNDHRVDESDVLTITHVTDPANGTATADNDGKVITYTPYADFHGLDTFEYTITDDYGGEDTATVTVTVIEAKEYIFLPLLTRPIQGEMSFSSDRFQGLTSFTSQVTVDFSSLNFGENEPDEMRVWLASEAEPNDWMAYAAEHTLPLDGSLYGFQQIKARFRYGSMETPPVSDTVFYIPNGDFSEDNLSDWEVIENDLPVEVVGGELQLGDPDFECVSVRLGMAGLSIDLEIPDSGNYALHMNATVHTYDQLPDPNDDTFDAFEVHINGNVTRHGNPVPGLNCSTKREVRVVGPHNDAWFLPSSQVELRLENHSRFDNFYNTYTLIDQIWIDKR